MADYAASLQRLESCLQNGRFEDFDDAVRDCNDFYTGGPRVHLAMLAVYYWKIGEIEKAQAHFEKVDDEIEDPSFTASYAIFQLEGHDIDEQDLPALEEKLQLAVDADSDLPETHFALYHLYAYQKKYSQAVDALKRALRRDELISHEQAFSVIQSWLQLLCDDQKFQEAKDISTKVVNFFCTTEFYLLHAKIAEHNNDTREAVKFYQRALKSIPVGNLRNEVLEHLALIAI